MSNLKKKYLVFDTETTGLPKKTGFNYDYKNLENFNNSRLVSISWILCNENFEILSKKSYIIKPKGFKISEESIKIHKITNEIAKEQGKKLSKVLEKFEKVLKKSDVIVAHNLNFDLAIISSELFRNDCFNSLELIEKKQRYCTMENGKLHCMNNKFPKLSELYYILYGEEAEKNKLHDAKYDTEYCYKCLIRLKKYTQNNNITLKN